MFPHDEKFKDLIKQLSHPEADALIELFTYGKREEIRLIRSAISMSEHVLKADITQFSPQMVGRLMSHRQHQMIEQFIQKLLAAQMPGIYPRQNETQWHSLDQAGGAVLHTYTKLIPPMAYSPDGSLIVSKASDNVFKIFDAETEQALLTLSDSQSRFQAVVYHPEGTQIAGISDQTLTVWDTHTGEVRFTAANHTYWPNVVIYSPNGRYIATPSSDGSIRIWKTETGEIFKILTIQSYALDMAYSPDGRYIASALSDNSIRIWHAKKGKLLNILTGHTSKVTSIDYSPTGRYLVSGSWDRTVKIWDTQTGNLIHTFTGHTHKVTAVMYHPNGWNVISASGDGTIRVWDVETRQLIRTLTRYADEVFLLAFRPDGRRIIAKTTSSRPTLLMFEPRQDTPINHVHTPYVKIAYSPDGRHLISGAYHNPIIVWDAKTGLEQKRIGNNDFFVSKLLYSPDQKHIMGIITGGIIIWDSTTHAQIFRIKIDFTWFNDAVYSSDGRFIVSVDGNGLIQCWDANSGQAITTLTEKINGEYYYREKLSNHPHQPLIAHAREDGTITLWDLEREIIIKTWQANTQTNVVETHKMVTYSPDGAYIATISNNDNGVKLWDANGTYLRRVLARKMDSSWDACFSPDGQYIATAGDGLQIWEVSTGRCLQTFYTDSSLHCCAWSPTENNVIAAGGGGRVMFLEWRR